MPNEPGGAPRGAHPMRRRGLTLLVDADDTLWENNIYFERVIERYTRLMAAAGHEARVARDVLYDIERVRTKIDGYGIQNFRASIQEAVGRLLGGDEAGRVGVALDRACAALAWEVPHVLEGVAPTLRTLSARHRLILFTKGDLDDQMGKLRRAGLSRYFHQVDVVREKDAATYREALERHAIRPSEAWMVGNSPRSDILPALACGLGAVFIPHAVTWALEQCEIPDAADRLLRLDAFSALTDHF